MQFPHCKTTGSQIIYRIIKEEPCKGELLVEYERCWQLGTLQLLHLLLSARNVHVSALPLVIDLLQARAVLTEGCLNLQLLFDGRIRQLQVSVEHHDRYTYDILGMCPAHVREHGHGPLVYETMACRCLWLHDCMTGAYLRTMAFHLCSSPEGALQASRRILDFLQLPLETLKLWLALHSYDAFTCRPFTCHRCAFGQSRPPPALYMQPCSGTQAHKLPLHQRPTHERSPAGGWTQGGQKPYKPEPGLHTWRSWDLRVRSLRSATACS